MKPIIGLSIFALCAGGAAYYQYVVQPPPSQYGVGLDNSLSMRPDCGGLAKQAQAAMTKSNGAREGSRLTLLAIGKSPNNPSPERLYDKAFPAGATSIAGQAEGVDEKRRQAFFDKFSQSCEAASSSASSPVLRLVSDGVADLRSKAPNPKARKFLIIQSDLMDDAEPSMRALLMRARKNPNVTAPPELARSIDNEATSVAFCGVSQTATGQKGSKPLNTAVLQNIYRQLFTHAELVSFRPFCGE